MNFVSTKEPDNISSIKLEPISGLSTVEGITPEPEDLLGEITSSATQENQTATDKVRHPLEDMIHASIERELSELSNSITQSIREIVQEITPKIVREIVKEEINKIKNS